MTPLFQIWGSRGGRNARGSKIGNSTSCYSLAFGAELFVFDAGHGLGALADAVRADSRLREVRRIHVLVSHAHMDHWEGLKDAEWLWRPGNGLELSVLGPKETLDAIHRAHEPPSFVPLEVLALGTVDKLAFTELKSGDTIALPGATLEAIALNHYSGIAPHEHHVDALGYQLTLGGGPVVAYLSDHQPTTATRAMEDRVLASSQLVVLDANYADVAEQAFGHGSVEHAAMLARRHGHARVLAAHHGPMITDTDIEDAHRRHGQGCANLAIAIEGRDEVWDAQASAFKHA